MADFEHTNLCLCQYSSCLDCSHFRHSTKQYLTKCPYRTRCEEKTKFTAAEWERRDCSRNKSRENGAYFATKAEKIPRAERAGSLCGETSTKEAVQKFSLFLLQISMQLVSREASTEAEIITVLVPDDTSIAPKFRPPFKGVDLCKRKLDDSRNEALAEKLFTKKNVINGSGTLV